MKEHWAMVVFMKRWFLAVRVFSAGIEHLPVVSPQAWPELVSEGPLGHSVCRWLWLHVLCLRNKPQRGAMVMCLTFPQPTRRGSGLPVPRREPELAGHAHVSPACPRGHPRLGVTKRV